MSIIKFFEFVGTVAFAVSGALIGVEKEMDLFGIIFLAITTSIGGGILRDIIIGNTPPVSFVNSIYCIISIMAAVITCLSYNRIVKFKNIFLLSDALGLGAFTAIGANTAIAHNMHGAFIIISMGLLTGVGGGILRDVFSKDIPVVFRKDIYAVASILGGVTFYFTYGVSHALALHICFGVTFVIRMLSILLNLNLPVFRHEKNINA